MAGLEPAIRCFMVLIGMPGLSSGMTIRAKAGGVDDG